MSSLRNSLHRRNHKERAQPAHRKRLGLLEKHKDYVQRAQDFNAKKQKIQTLKQKAAERNKDEFYFGMVNAKTKGGVHFQERGNRPLPTDLVKVLKSQDEGYIRATKVANLKRIDRLKDELSSLLRRDLINEDADSDGVDKDGWEDDELEALRSLGLVSQKRRRHTVFVDDAASVKTYSIPQRASLSTEIMTDDVDLGWLSSPSSTASKSKSIQSKSEDVSSLSSSSQEVQKRRKDILSELLARHERDTHLSYALRELEMQRAMMGKGASRKIRAPELITEQGDKDEMDEDELDALIAKRGKVKDKKPPEMAEYKPRVYKFRTERKR